MLPHTALLCYFFLLLNESFLNDKVDSGDEIESSAKVLFKQPFTTFV